MERIKPRLHKLLLDAIAVEGAVKGNIQKYCSTTDRLEIVSSEGFTQEFLTHFKTVRPFDPTCCGRAFGIGSAIIISDVEKDAAFAPHIQAAKEAGFRAVKSVPIIDKKGQKVGVLSTHYTDPKWTWDTAKLEDILTSIHETFDEINVENDSWEHWFDDHGVLHVKAHKALNTEQKITEFRNNIAGKLQSSGKICCIADLRDALLTDEVMNFAKSGATKIYKAIAYIADPQIDEITEKAMSALQGEIPVSVFSTRDAAKKWIKQYL